MADPPEEHDARQTFEDLRDVWKPRQKIVYEGRLQLAYLNKVAVPEVSHLDPVKLLMGELITFRDERLSQFRVDRLIRCLPMGTSEEALKRATHLERWIEAALYWSRRTRDEFGKCVGDCVIFDGAVERWEPVVNEAWPLLIPDMEDEEPSDHFSRTYRDDPERAYAEREAYKKTRPLPVDNTYVRLEDYYPAHNRDDTDFAMEVEFRPLRSVLSNKLFERAGKARVQAGFRDTNRNVRNEVAILRYCDDAVYAYYAIVPSTDSTTGHDRSVPIDAGNDMRLNGDVVYLHHYEHNVGRPLYNEFIGAHGGWRALDTSMISGRIRALLGLAQARDDLASQEMTAARNSTWQQYVINVSYKRPPTLDGGRDPNAPARKTGEDVYLYEGEQMQPLYEPKPNPLFLDAKEEVKQQFRLLAGSSALLGQHQAGVGTGYHENVLIQRSESQFQRLEMGIATGATNGILLMLEIVAKAIREPVYARYKGKAKGREYIETLVLDPEKDLNPMPMLDASVRAMKPQDWPIALRAYTDATSAPNGPGTNAFPRSRARAEILGDEHPDETESQVQIERIKDEFWASGVPTQWLAQRVNMILIEETAPTPSPEEQMLAGQDPAFAQAALGFMGEGGMGVPGDPLNGGGFGSLPEATPGIGAGRGGGSLPGMAQPEQAIGRGEGLLQDPQMPL